MHEITIAKWRPVLHNEAQRMHYHTRARKKKQDEAIIAFHALQYPQATGKRKVSLHFILGKGEREFDVDAPWKNLLDGLVKCGALVDDSAKWCEQGGISFERGEKATIIKLVDIP